MTISSTLYISKTNGGQYADVITGSAYITASVSHSTDMLSIQHIYIAPKSNYSSQTNWANITTKIDITPGNLTGTSFDATTGSAIAATQNQPSGTYAAYVVTNDTGVNAVIESTNAIILSGYNVVLKQITIPAEQSSFIPISTEDRMTLVSFVDAMIENSSTAGGNYRVDTITSVFGNDAIINYLKWNPKFWANYNFVSYTQFGVSSATITDAQFNPITNYPYARTSIENDAEQAFTDNTSFFAVLLLSRIPLSTIFNTFYPTTSYLYFTYCVKRATRSRYSSSAYTTAGITATTINYNKNIVNLSSITDFSTYLLLDELDAQFYIDKFTDVTPTKVSVISSDPRTNDNYGATSGNGIDPTAFDPEQYAFNNLRSSVDILPSFLHTTIIDMWIASNKPAWDTWLDIDSTTGLKKTLAPGENTGFMLFISNVFSLTESSETLSYIQAFASTAASTYKIHTQGIPSTAISTDPFSADIITWLSHDVNYSTIIANNFGGNANLLFSYLTYTFQGDNTVHYLYANSKFTVDITTLLTAGISIASILSAYSNESAPSLIMKGYLPELSARYLRELYYISNIITFAQFVANGDSTALYQNVNSDITNGIVNITKVPSTFKTSNVLDINKVNAWMLLHEGEDIIDSSVTTPSAGLLTITGLSLSISGTTVTLSGTIPSSSLVNYVLSGTGIVKGTKIISRTSSSVYTIDVSQRISNGTNITATFTAPSLLYSVPINALNGHNGLMGSLYDLKNLTSNYQGILYAMAHVKTDTNDIVALRVHELYTKVGYTTNEITTYYSQNAIITLKTEAAAGNNRSLSHYTIYDTYGYSIVDIFNAICTNVQNESAIRAAILLLKSDGFTLSELVTAFMIDSSTITNITYFYSNDLWSIANIRALYFTDRLAGFTENIFTNNGDITTMQLLLYASDTLPGYSAFKINTILRAITTYSTYLNTDIAWLILQLKKSSIDSSSPQAYDLLDGTYGPFTKSEINALAFDNVNDSLMVNPKLSINHFIGTHAADFISLLYASNTKVNSPNPTLSIQNILTLVFATETVTTLAYRTLLLEKSSINSANPRPTELLTSTYGSYSRTIVRSLWTSSNHTTNHITIVTGLPSGTKLYGVNVASPYYLNDFNFAKTVSELYDFTLFNVTDPAIATVISQLTGMNATTGSGGTSEIYKNVRVALDNLHMSDSDASHPLPIDLYTNNVFLRSEIRSLYTNLDMTFLPINLATLTSNFDNTITRQLAYVTDFTSSNDFKTKLNFNNDAAAISFAISMMYSATSESHHAEPYELLTFGFPGSTIAADTTVSAIRYLDNHANGTITDNFDNAINYLIQGFHNIQGYHVYTLLSIANDYGYNTLDVVIGNNSNTSFVPRSLSASRMASELNKGGFSLLDIVNALDASGSNYTNYHSTASSGSTLIYSALYGTNNSLLYDGTSSNVMWNQSEVDNLIFDGNRTGKYLAETFLVPVTTIHDAYTGESYPLFTFDVLTGNTYQSVVVDGVYATTSKTTALGILYASDFTSQRISFLTQHNYNETALATFARSLPISSSNSTNPKPRELLDYGFSVSVVNALPEITRHNGYGPTNISVLSELIGYVTSGTVNYSTSVVKSTFLYNIDDFVSSGFVDSIIANVASGLTVSSTNKTKWTRRLAIEFKHAGYELAESAAKLTQLRTVNGYQFDNVTLGLMTTNYPASNANSYYSIDQSISLFDNANAVTMWSNSQFNDLTYNATGKELFVIWGYSVQEIRARIFNTENPSLSLYALIGKDFTNDMTNLYYNPTPSTSSYIGLLYADDVTKDMFNIANGFPNTYLDTDPGLVANYIRRLPMNAQYNTYYYSPFDLVIKYGFDSSVILNLPAITDNVNTYNAIISALASLQEIIAFFLANAGQQTQYETLLWRFLYQLNHVFGYSAAELISSPGSFLSTSNVGQLTTQLIAAGYDIGTVLTVAKGQASTFDHALFSSATIINQSLSAAAGIASVLATTSYYIDNGLSRKYGNIYTISTFILTYDKATIDTYFFQTQAYNSYVLENTYLFTKSYIRDIFYNNTNYGYSIDKLITDGANVTGLIYTTDNDTLQHLINYTSSNYVSTNTTFRNRLNIAQNASVDAKEIAIVSFVYNQTINTFKNQNPYVLSSPLILLTSDQTTATYVDNNHPYLTDIALMIDNNGPSPSQSAIQLMVMSFDIRFFYYEVVHATNTRSMTPTMFYNYWQKSDLINYIMNNSDSVTIKSAIEFVKNSDTFQLSMTDFTLTQLFNDGSYTLTEVATTYMTSHGLPYGEELLEAGWTAANIRALYYATFSNNIATSKKQSPSITFANLIGGGYMQNGTYNELVYAEDVSLYSDMQVIAASRIPSSTKTIAIQTIFDNIRSYYHTDRALYYDELRTIVHVLGTDIIIAYSVQIIVNEADQTRITPDQGVNTYNTSWKVLAYYYALTAAEIAQNSTVVIGTDLIAVGVQMGGGMGFDSSDIIDAFGVTYSETPSSQSVNKFAQLINFGSYTSMNNSILVPYLATQVAFFQLFTNAKNLYSNVSAPNSGSYFKKYIIDILTTTLNKQGASSINVNDALQIKICKFIYEKTQFSQATSALSFRNTFLPVDVTSDYSIVTTVITQNLYMANIFSLASQLSAGTTIPLLWNNRGDNYGGSSVEELVAGLKTNNKTDVEILNSLYPYIDLKYLLAYNTANPPVRNISVKTALQGVDGNWGIKWDTVNGYYTDVNSDTPSIDAVLTAMLGVTIISGDLSGVSDAAANAAVLEIKNAFKEVDATSHAVFSDSITTNAAAALIDGQNIPFAFAFKIFSKTALVRATTISRTQKRSMFKGDTPAGPNTSTDDNVNILIALQYLSAADTLQLKYAIPIYFSSRVNYSALNLLQAVDSTTLDKNAYNAEGFEYTMQGRLLWHVLSDRNLIIKYQLIKQGVATTSSTLESLFTTDMTKISYSDDNMNFYYAKPENLSDVAEISS